MNYEKEIYKLLDCIFGILGDVNINLYSYEVEQWNENDENEYDETYDYDELLLNLPGGYYVTKHFHYVSFKVLSMKNGRLQVVDRDEQNEQHEVKLEDLDTDSIVELYSYLKNEGLI